MKQFKYAKAEYENIVASKRLKERVEKELKRKSKTPMIVKLSFSAAALVMAVCVVLLNVNPDFAHAAGGSAAMNAIIKVVTFGRYQHQENGYEAKVVTPQIEGLLDKDFEQKLNKEFKENANAVISAYEKDLKELKELYGDDTIHMGVVSDYIIKTDTDDILAIDVYLLNVAGSSSTIHTFYTIDKKTGSLLTLKGLFKEGADYITPISDYILNEMKRRNIEEEAMFWVEGDEFITEIFEKIEPNQNFYISSEGDIVICFNKYEIAAGAQGSPEFVIPKEVIAPILAFKNTH